MAVFLLGVTISMIKKSICFTSFLFALFSLFSLLQFFVIRQQQFPFHTTVQFDLYITNPNMTKDDIVSDLNKMVDLNHSTLVKVSIDTENYQEKKDIVWFGTQKPTAKNLMIEDDKISWLDVNLTGELISSTEIGARPLYGTYAMEGADNFKIEIDKWAHENDLTIHWLKTPSQLLNIWIFISNGIGNAVLTSFLLFLSSIVAWFITHAKARAIRFQAGISHIRIHAEDTATILKTITIGFIFALISMLGYILFTNGIQHIPLIILSNLRLLILLELLIGLFTFVISLMVRPRTEHLANRKIPLKRFKLLGTLTRIVSIILALLVIPSTIISAYIVKQLANEYALWENIQSNVRVSFGELDSLESENMLPNVEGFFYDMEQSDNLSLSYVIDRVILLSDEEYGGYDHLVLADKSWVESFEVGINEENENGKLIEIHIQELAKPLQTFLHEQMPLWTKTEEVKPKGIAFFEFIGEKFLALPPNVAQGGNTVQAENPLVILVESPSLLLNTTGFLIPAASSGNIVFKDQVLLRSALSHYQMNEYITSVDAISEQALEQAKLFAKEAIFYIVACVLIFLSMVFAGIMNAQLWVGSNQKRIFTLHTFGKTYSEIVQTPFKKELMIEVVTIVFGCIISFLIRRPDPLILIWVAVTIVLLYGIANIITYQLCARKTFYQMSRRGK